MSRLSIRCICTVDDAAVKDFAKARNLPLTYVRSIKRMHKKYHVHELYREDPLNLKPSNQLGIKSDR